MKYPDLSFYERHILGHFQDEPSFNILDVEKFIYDTIGTDVQIGYYLYYVHTLKEKGYIKNVWDHETSEYTVTAKGIWAMHLYSNGISIEYNEESIWRRIWKTVTNFWKPKELSKKR